MDVVQVFDTGDVTAELRAGAAPLKDDAFFSALASAAVGSVAPERGGALRRSRAVKLAAVAASTAVIISGAAYASVLTFRGNEGSVETPSSTNPTPTDDRRDVGDNETPETAADNADGGHSRARGDGDTPDDVSSGPEEGDSPDVESSPEEGRSPGGDSGSSEGDSRD